MAAGRTSVALYPWRTGDPIPDTEGMVSRGRIRVGDSGPVPGTVWNGDCPWCEEAVFSSSTDHEAGVRNHMALRHPSRARTIGIRTADPDRPGWDRVGDLLVPRV